MVGTRGVHVIKRAGASEPFHADKLHASVIAACRAVRALEGEAVMVADRVAHAVTQWAGDKAEITARDLHVQAALSLAVLHPAAAYAYDTHDVVI